jgi:hypothetical protein
MKIYSAQLKGTTTVSTGSNVSLTGSFSGSIYGFDDTIQYSSSVSSDLSNLESKSASVDISISNINSVTASNIARLSNLESKSASVDISISNINQYTGSNDTKWTTLTNVTSSLIAATGSYATTGSNSFYGTQVFSGSVFIANDLIVQGSSSIQYISASSVSIGTNIVQLNTANPSVRYAGLTMIDSGSVGGSGSFLYDSLQDEFIFVHRGNGSNITSSHFVLGPETYDSLGNETYLTSNIIPKGTGKEHLVDSCIFDNGITTCIKNNLVITGTISGTTIYGSTAVCSPVGKFTSCIDVGSGTFSDTLQLNKAGGLAFRAYYGSGNNLPLDINVDAPNGDASLTFNTTYNTGWKYYVANYAARISNAGTLKFQVAPAGAAGCAITWVDALAFNNTTGAATFACNLSVGGILQVKSTSSTPSIWSGQFGGAISILGDNSTSNRYIDLSIVDSTGALATQGLRLVNSGNVGIGTGNPIQKLDVLGNGNFGGVSTPYIDFKSADTTGVGWQYKQISFKDATNTELYAIGYHWPNLKFDVYGSRVMTLMCGGNVGIGTNCPCAKLTIVKATRSSTLGASSVLQILDASAAGQAVGDRAEINFYTNSDSLGGNLQHATIGIIKTSTTGNETADLYFGTSTIGGSPVERMRITSAGTLMVGACINNGNADVSPIAQMIAPRGTTTYPLTLTTCGAAAGGDQIRMTFNYGVNWSATAYIGSCVENAGSAATGLVFGTYSGGLIESLRISSTGIACFRNTICAPCFATISDYRMKSNLRPIEGLSIIMNTKPYKFEYNYDCSTSFGMIAHELQDTLPEAVFGQKDGEVMQGVDYMKLLPITIKAIQEQQCTICTQASMINILKSCIGIV